MLHYFICLKILKLYLSEHGKENARFTTWVWNYHVILWTKIRSLSTTRLKPINYKKYAVIFKLSDSCEYEVIAIRNKTTHDMIVHISISPLLCLELWKGTYNCHSKNKLFDHMFKKKNFLALCQAKCWVRDKAPTYTLMMQ